MQGHPGHRLSSFLSFLGSSSLITLTRVHVERWLTLDEKGAGWSHRAAEAGEG